MHTAYDTESADHTTHHTTPAPDPHRSTLRRASHETLYAVASSEMAAYNDEPMYKQIVFLLNDWSGKWAVSSSKCKKCSVMLLKVERIRCKQLSGALEAKRFARPSV